MPYHLRATQCARRDGKASHLTEDKHTGILVEVAHDDGFCKVAAPTHVWFSYTQKPLPHPEHSRDDESVWSIYSSPFCQVLHLYSGFFTSLACTVRQTAIQLYLLVRQLARHPRRAGVSHVTTLEQAFRTTNTTGWSSSTYSATAARRMLPLSWLQCPCSTSCQRRTPS